MPISDSDVLIRNGTWLVGIVGKSIISKCCLNTQSNGPPKRGYSLPWFDYSPYTPMTNCRLIDFEGMLRDGFDWECRSRVLSPSKPATAQISQIIANVASSQYGCLAPDRWSLGPLKKNYQNTLADVMGALLSARGLCLEQDSKSYLWCHATLNMRSIPLYFRTGKTPFTSLWFLVLEPIVWAGNPKGDLWKLE